MCAVVYVCGVCVGFFYEDQCVGVCVYFFLRNMYFLVYTENKVFVVFYM